VRQTTETVKAASGTPLDRLSNRELEVLDLASHGSTNSEIGERLGLTVHAVKFHLASIYRKLGVANRTEAAAAFLTSVVTAPSRTDEEAG
jgi:DNA-binding NarL/FixJ family response regulator